MADQLAARYLPQANALTLAKFVARFGGVFEHSPWVAERAAAERQRRLVSLVQHRQADAERAVRLFGAADRLEHQIHRRALFDAVHPEKFASVATYESLVLKRLLRRLPSWALMRLRSKLAGHG